MVQPLKYGRLRKKFLWVLWELPEGAYLVSTAGDAPGQPCFAETLVPLDERNAQWQRIKVAHVDYLLCFVIATPLEFARSSLETRYPRARN